MPAIGYHCSHEQFAPSALLRYVRMAEQAGFGAAMCSDHFYPWSERQGQSGFAWSWLGAAMQATALSFGVVNAPGQRYHPAIIAQAAATLEEMFPGRFWIAVGSGQAMNEHITGDPWPSKPERNARLEECVDLMRALWAGETVGLDDHHTRKHIRIKNARLYTRPDSPPPIIGAAITEKTAEWVGSWADGLITVSRPHDELAKVIRAFREGGGGGKPAYLQAQICHHPDEAEAYRMAHDQWRTNIFESPVLATLEDPAQFDAAAEFIRPEDLDGHVRISADPKRHVEWLERDFELGFDAVYVHHVGRDQERFLGDFGEHVLPNLKAATGASNHAGRV